ncbi:MAG: methyltransferase domain-containing protein [Actinobacteria bacterium]|nr:methyltransferase domain-containing protein [Actinomycetota bacterium]
MPVHEVAQRGFGDGADAYERARPSYPPEAAEWFVDNLRIAPGARVCDLAAGTGKLTRLLVPTGASLFAIEPVEGMSAHLRAALPSVPVVASMAEQLPLADGSLDAVTVAQAFHWFDADRAFGDLARVLRPRGRVGIIWNIRDRTNHWVNEVWSIMDRVEKRAPWRDHEQWSADALGVRPGFGELHQAGFRHTQRLSPDDVVDRIASVSHVVVLPDDERQRVLDEVRTVLTTHPDTIGRDELDIPYRVDAYWCERLP